jgi:ABC-type multidrug transport system fused ATPase/permease subunit
MLRATTTGKCFFRDFFFVLGKDKHRLPGVYALVLLATALDIVGIGLIVPLIVALTQGGTGKLSKLSFATSAVSPTVLILFVVLAFLCRALMGYRAQKSIIRFTESHRSALMVRLLEAYLAKPYEFFFGRNSAEMINHILYTTSQYSSGTLAAVLKLMADATSCAAILVLLAWSNWQAVALLSAVMVAALAYYDRVVKTKINQAGVVLSEASEEVIGVVNHSLGALREVRVLGIEKQFLRRLEAQSAELAEAHGRFAALSSIPRHVIEFSVILVLVLMSFLVVWHRIEGSALMPLMGLFGIAALRLVPGATSIMSSVNSLRLNQHAVTGIANDLREVDDAAPLVISEAVALRPRVPIEEIRFEGVSYTYAGALHPAVRDLSFVIRSGQAIGLMGRSGSGKSTTADILLGLLRPQTGKVLADGLDIRSDLRAWMDRFAYIPQSVFLLDDDLVGNVALGVTPEYVDAARLSEAIRVAGLEGVLAELPKGALTRLGERGIRLSGGQRQRVALARALYHNRDIIVMDEATAALDNATEREVVSAIRSLRGHKTLVIIAHRLSTLEGCDVVLRMEDGGIVESGSFDEVVLG